MYVILQALEQFKTVHARRRPTYSISLMMTTIPIPSKHMNLFLQSKLEAHSKLTNCFVYYIPLDYYVL